MLAGERRQHAGQVVGGPVAGHVGLAEADRAGGAEPGEERFGTDEPASPGRRRRRRRSCAVGSATRSGMRLAARWKIRRAIAVRTGECGTAATSGQSLGSIGLCGDAACTRSTRVIRAVSQRLCSMAKHKCSHHTTRKNSHERIGRGQGSWPVAVGQTEGSNRRQEQATRHRGQCDPRWRGNARHGPMCNRPRPLPRTSSAHRSSHSIERGRGRSVEHPFMQSTCIRPTT